MYKDRFVIDEQVFEFKNQSNQIIEKNLTEFANILEELQLKNIDIQLPISWMDIQFNSNGLFVDYLYSNNIERDLRNRLYKHINKCKEIDVKTNLSIGNVVYIRDSNFFSDGINLALHNILLKIATAVVTMEYRQHQGVQLVKKSDKQSDIHFIERFDQVVVFVRSIFEIEDISEANFFVYAAEAFPDLIFSPNLNFNKFIGTYNNLRSVVVEHLSALNDDFAASFESENGLSDRISTRIRISVSIESVSTRNSKKMKLRQVKFRDEIFLCEWHSKLEPHQNRIHFCLIHNEDKTKVFIGIFVDHLET